MSGEDDEKDAVTQSEQNLLELQLLPIPYPSVTLSPFKSGTEGDSKTLLV